MVNTKNLVKLAVISTLALTSCKTPSYEGFVTIGDKKINCSSSDSTEYVELFDELSKIKVQYFYNTKEKQMDSIIFSQDVYKTKMDKNNFPEILKEKIIDFRDYQIKFSLNKSLDSLFPEKKEE